MKLHQLDQRLSAPEPQHDNERGANARPSVVALAMSVGLILFLILNAVPGRLSGVSGFVIGFASVVALVSVAMVVAVFVEGRQRRLHDEELVSVLTAAVLLLLDQQVARSEKWSEESSLSVAYIRELLGLLDRLRREQSK